MAIEIEGRTQYAPVGVCIYCLEHQSKLTDEHVIPFAFAGDGMVLPKSSCKECAAVTGRFEQEYLRCGLGIFRNRIGAPTRRPNDRSATPLVGVGRRIDGGQLQDSGERVEVPIHEMPIAYIAMRFFGAPRILTGRAPTGDIDGELWWCMWPEQTALQKVARGTEGLHIGSLRPITFARFIAKVAHGYAVADVGLNTFDPLLLDLIAGRTEEISFLIGGDEDIPLPRNEQFVLQSGWVSLDNVTYLVVQLQLYANLGTPKYLVVVGRKKSVHE
jgi:hypothetical protein